VKMGIGTMSGWASARCGAASEMSVGQCARRSIVLTVEDGRRYGRGTETEETRTCKSGSLF
jgi:hypothetical protein